MHPTLRLALFALLLLLSLNRDAGSQPAPAPSAQPAALGYYNIRDYGAVGDGAHDDTAAIQTAIEALRLTGGTLFFPRGKYSISSLNCTDFLQSITLLGEGAQTTVLAPNTSGVNVLDLTGSRAVILNNLCIGTPDPKVVPKTGILLAEGARFPGSDRFHFENLYVSSHFSVAAVYVWVVSSSDMINCDFYNYQDSLDAAALAFTSSNYANVESDFTTTSAHREYFCSDWTLTACEIHNISAPRSASDPAAPPTQASATAALRLDGVLGLRMVGGNISSDSIDYVRLAADNRWLVFIGVGFYTDMGPLPKIGFNNAAGISGLALTQCSVQIDDTILGGAADAVYDDVQFSGKPTLAFGSPQYVFDCPQGKLLNATLHCDGLALRAGTISAALLINPGPIESPNDRSTKILP